MQRQSHTDPRPGLTKRQSEVLDRLELGASVKRIAKDIGVTPAAVYQTIDRLRRGGFLPEEFTPSGEPRRRGGLARSGIPGEAVGAGGRMSRLSEVRTEDDDERLGDLIDTAIVSGDAPALAYCLGRADGRREEGFRRGIIEAALRRLELLPREPAKRATVAAQDERAEDRIRGGSDTEGRRREPR